MAPERTAPVRGIPSAAVELELCGELSPNAHFDSKTPHGEAGIMDLVVNQNAAVALDHLVARAGQLYSLPAVALEVLELTQQPQIDIRAVKECIENDPALTTKVLRVVNSSLFGLGREVSDLNHALTLLGIKPLKLLVLGFSLSDAVFSKLTGRWIGRYWRHTLIKAVSAREISETIWRVPGDEPFLIALLQDLGLLVLLQELGEPFAAFLDRVWKADGDLLSLERESLGFDHRELTARMLALWGLPPQFITGVLADRNEQDFLAGLPAQRALPPTLRLAELMSDLLAEGRPRALETLLAGESPVPMSHDQLLAFVERSQLKMDNLAEVFSLELPEGQTNREMLAKAQTQLALVAEAAAVELLAARRSSRGIDIEIEQSLLAQARDLTNSLRRAISQGARPAEPIAPTGAPLRRQHAAAPLPKPILKRTAITQEIDSSIDHDPTLDVGLATAVAACRHSRIALSLALIEIDEFDRIEREQGQLRAQGILEQLATACQRFNAPAMMCFRTRRTRFALVLPNWDRHQCSEFHQQLLESLRDIVIEEPDGQLSVVSVSVGLASVSHPPKNFDPRSLLESATRCLAAARRSGGGAIKSIGIY